MKTGKSLKVFYSQDGSIVMREGNASGEHSYRWSPAGWSYCPDHKGPWLAIAENNVPARFREVVDDLPIWVQTLAARL